MTTDEPATSGQRLIVDRTQIAGNYGTHDDTGISVRFGQVSDDAVSPARMIRTDHRCT